MRSLLLAVTQLAVGLLGWWRSGAEKRAERRADEKVEEMRKEIATGDADAVSRRLDKLRRKKADLS